MTGVIAEFFADLREVRQDERDARRRAKQARSDPLVDLRTLPPEALRPIQPWVDDYLTAPRFERRVGFLGVDFTIRRGPRGPMVRYSELIAVFGRFTELATTSERAARRQAAEIEAESGLAVAKGRANSLNERLMRAMEAQTLAELRLDTAWAEIAALKQQQEAGAHVQRQLDKQHAVNVALSQHVDDLIAETAALKEEVARLHALAKRRAERESDIIAILTDNDALDTQVQTLRGEQQRLKDENASLRAEAEAHTGAQAKSKQLAEQNDALAKRVAALLRKAAILKSESARWKAQAQGDARGAVRYWAEKALGSKAGRRPRA